MTELQSTRLPEPKVCSLDEMVLALWRLLPFPSLLWAPWLGLAMRGPDGLTPGSSGFIVGPPRMREPAENPYTWLDLMHRLLAAGSGVCVHA